MIKKQEYEQKLFKFTQGIIDFSDSQDINLISNIEEIFKIMCENEQYSDKEEKDEIKKMGLTYIEDAKRILGFTG